MTGAPEMTVTAQDEYGAPHQIEVSYRAPGLIVLEDDDATRTLGHEQAIALITAMLPLILRCHRPPLPPEGRVV